MEKYSKAKGIFAIFKRKELLAITLVITLVNLVAIMYTSQTRRLVYGSRTKVKHVLFTTKWWGKHNWFDISEGDLMEYTSRAGCPIHQCEFTYSATNTSLYDALVFHYSDLFDFNQAKGIWRWHKQRQPHQRWVFFTHENPFHRASYRLWRLDGYFNWTMSYTRSSEVMLTYFRAKEQPSERGYVNHALGKRELVVFAVSHCGTFREKYVQQLQDYISVTVFGNCSDYYQERGGKCERGSAGCAALMQQFKFYLAFENAFCHDYVTEKYWENSLMAGLVPVVMGANYDHLNSIPGSYIDVSDFPSIEALADHLLYLDKNDTAYNEYFKWKQSYTVVHNDMFCKLCQELHNENHPKRHVYDNLDAFWSPKKHCDGFYKREKKLRKQVEDSEWGL